MDIADGRKKAEATKRNLVHDPGEAPSKRWKCIDDGKKRSVETGTEDNSGASILQLPDELFIKIMEMVPIAQWASLERVSRRFETVVHGVWARTREIRLDELVYKGKKLKKDPSRVLNLVLRKLFWRAPDITSIGNFFDFCGEYKSISRTSIPALARFKHLQKIRFSGRRISAENFAIFLETSASRQCLRYLNVWDSVQFGYQKSIKLVAALGSGDNLPAMQLQEFVLDPRYLHSFDFHRRFDWSALKKFVIGFCVFGVPILCTIIGQCIQLEHLELEIPYCGFHQPPHSQLLEGVAKLENLSILKMKTCMVMPCSSFQAALVTLIQDLGRRRRITGLALDHINDDQIVSAICGHLPYLKSLELKVGKCKESSLKLLVTELKELEVLELRLLTVATMKGGVINVMAASLGNLKRLLIECFRSQHSKGLTHLQNVEGLKELIVIGREIHGSIVEAWSHPGFGSFLETLEISFPSDVSSNVVAGLFCNLPHLRVLRSIGLTDGSLKAIADSCPRLITLELLLSPKITRAGIQAVIDHCSQLKLLNVIGLSLWFPKELKVGKYRKIVFGCSWDSESQCR